MIEADASSLSSFLKNSGATNVPAVVNNAPAVVEPVKEVMKESTDNIETFVKLVDSVGKLLNSPLVQTMMSKGIERKSQAQEPQPQPVEVPEGFNPVDNINTPQLQTQSSSNDLNLNVDKREKAEMFYGALLRAVEEIKTADPQRTVLSLFEELEQEQVKEQLINQLEVLV